MKAILEGSTIHSPEELHDALIRILDLPDYYGCNLDALWECLTGAITLPTELVWRDYEECRRTLGQYAEKVLDVFREAEQEGDGFTVVVC